MSQISQKTESLSLKAFEALKASGKTLATVESCTGGLIAKSITDHAGSSAVFEYGFVTYANEAKTALVGVSSDLLKAHGAVSLEVALAMAQGGLERSGADYCLSVTGIAGPGGTTLAKPVGLVFIACAKKAAEATVKKYLFENINRDFIRHSAAISAFELLLEAIEQG